MSLWLQTTDEKEKALDSKKNAYNPQKNLSEPV